MMNHTMVNDVDEPFGAYAPGRASAVLRWLTALGVCRGVVCKRIGKQWRKQGYSIVDARVRGINYRLHIDKNTTDAKLLCSSKVYDGTEIHALAAPLRSASPGEAVFVDIGANTGYYALSLARRGYGRIIAVEPNPVTLQLLRFNIGVNDFARSITVVPLCIGDGQATPFYCSGVLGAASVIKASHRCEPVMVDSAPLLDILNDNRITRVDALKIDIEGYEDRALEPFFKSAPQTLHPSVIVIEVCNKDLWRHDVMTLLKHVGYTLRKQTRANCIFTKP